MLPESVDFGVLLRLGKCYFPEDFVIWVWLCHGGVPALLRLDDFSGELFSFGDESPSGVCFVEGSGMDFLVVDELEVAVASDPDGGFDDAVFGDDCSVFEPGVIDSLCGTPGVVLRSFGGPFVVSVVCGHDIFLRYSA